MDLSVYYRGVPAVDRRVAPPARRNRGFSLVELVVSLAIFGVALSGLGPHVVMHIKHLRKLESRLPPDTTHYLVQSMDAWARKLGAPAAIVTFDPGSVAPLPDAEQANQVEVVSLEKWLTGEEVSARVLVEEIDP